MEHLGRYIGFLILFPVLLFARSAHEPAHADVTSTGAVCINDPINCPTSVLAGEATSQQPFGANGSIAITPPTTLSTGTLILGNSPSNTITGQTSISGSGASLRVSNVIDLGLGFGIGVLNVTNRGFLNFTGSSTNLGTSGVSQSSQGFLNVSDPGSIANFAGSTIVGRAGLGTVNVSNFGVLNANSITLGSSLGGSGRLNILSGAIVNGNFLTEGGHSGGIGGQATIDGIGSALNLTGANAAFRLGDAAGAQGNLVVSNGGHVNVNATGTGTVPGFTIGGPFASGTGQMIVTRPGSQVLVTGDTATSTLSPGFTVGRAGAGDLQITNGGSVIVQNPNGFGGFNVGGIGGTAGNGFPVGTGSIEVTGAGSKLDVQASHGNFIVGSRDGGIGTVSVSAGGMLHAENGTLGNTSLSTGTLNIAGAGTSVVLNGDDGAGNGAILRVGGSGNGTLNVSNGASLTINPTSGIGGGGLVAGGTSTQTSGVGTINVDGGRILINGDTSTRLSLGGGTGGSANLDITNGGQVVLSPSSGLGGVYVSRAPGSMGNALISGSGSLLSAGNFLGIGVAQDQVSNSGVGTVTLSAGGAISASAIRIGAQGSLFGTGTISGNLTDAGGTIKGIIRLT